MLAQQENYKKFGFQLAHRNIRYQGSSIGEITNSAAIVELKSLTFEEIYAYDRAFFPDDRRQFLRCWIAQPESLALGILENGKLAGYGVLRVARIGYKIGPLFADSGTLAEALFLALQSRAEPDASIYLDVPEVNPSAIDLAQRYGMKAVFETARMYTKLSPALPFERWYGVTTFELG